VIARRTWNNRKQGEKDVSKKSSHRWGTLALDHNICNGM
jgi:hypothetical protein